MEPEQTTQQNPDSDDIVAPPDFKEHKTDKPVKNHKPSDGSHWERFLNWYKTDKKKSIPLTVLAVVLLIALVPWSRYHAAGLMLKKSFSLQVMDSKTHSPVSGALVAIGSAAATTDGSGKVTLRSLPVGHHKASVIKKYYLDEHIDVLVPILRQKSHPSISFMATGRQVKIITTDLISKQKLSGVDIEVADIKAKTDKSGAALIVVPIGVSSEKVKLSFKGYNDTTAIIQVSDKEIKENNLNLTPSGKVYFLSKLSGKIDVVKANLDGSERKTVVAGTGKEDDRNTVLLASRDWKYLALLSNRDGPTKLFVISADDDQLLTMDQGNATFTPIGWKDHYFMFTVNRNDYKNWQPNSTSVKSYNADTGKMLTMVNSNASGSSDADAEYENIWSTLIVGDDLVYTRTWYKYPGYLNVDGKQNVLAAIRPDGTNSRQLKTADASQSYFSNPKLNKPRQVYFGVYSNGNSATGYFGLDKNGNITPLSGVGDKDLLDEATTYLASPSGDQSFWQDERDGKNTLFIGDQDADNAKQLASLSEYNVYGWYGNDYLLVSKNSSQLYAISKNGLKKDSEAVKVTDYHKPAKTYYGYGGGYGGL